MSSVVAAVAPAATVVAVSAARTVNHGFVLTGLPILVYVVGHLRLRCSRRRFRAGQRRHLRACRRGTLRVGNNDNNTAERAAERIVGTKVAELVEARHRTLSDTGYLRDDGQPAVATVTVANGGPSRRGSFQPDVFWRQSIPVR